MDNPAYVGEDGIQVTSFAKNEVTSQPIRGLDDVGKDAPAYTEIPLDSEKDYVEIKIDAPKVTRFDSSTPTTPTSPISSPTSAISSPTSPISSPTCPYPNMSKEDVLRFSETSFWRTLRSIALLIFWLLWLGFLATVIALTITTPRCTPPPLKQWYHKGVFYDVYVRSFYDSNDDGIGDIKGVEAKLPLLSEMGVDVVVLSSILQSRDENSPSAGLYNGKFDYGYEVTDYKVVDSSLGSADDFASLINATHELGMKLVMDFVPNHSGIDHTWYSDFIGATGFDSGWNNYLSANSVPNNWKNFYDTDKVAWTHTEPGNLNSKLYYNQYLETQPELNLRSDFIRKQIEESLEYWMEMGVDGFRIVNSDFLIENADLDPNPDNDFTATRYHNDSIDLLARWKSLVENFDEKKTRVIITDGDSSQRDFPYRYYRKGCGGGGSHVPTNFDLVDIIKGITKPVDLVESLKTFISKIPERSIALWTTGGQDHSRVESRSGVNMTRPLTLLKMTLPGSASVYYGEEIEMVDDAQVDNLDKDPVVELKAGASRFGFRQPMLWFNTTNAGFSPSTTTTPWLTLNPTVDLISKNVEYQRKEATSVWKLVETLSRFRNKRTSLQHGNIHFGYYDDHLVTYLREYQGDDRLLIVINLGDTESKSADVTQKYGHPIEPTATIALTTHPMGGPYQEGGGVDLRGVAPLPPGYGFVAKWKFVRSL